ncbi:hypothetical protein SAMN05428949_4828 [Chitinophaga sp. YR627]|nr:hypothetical protein SAMN05428949_4828 [Chitinophaga sp. YR627]
MRYALDDSLSATSGVVSVSEEYKNLMLLIDVYQHRLAGAMQIVIKKMVIFTCAIFQVGL